MLDQLDTDVFANKMKAIAPHLGLHVDTLVYPEQIELIKNNLGAILEDVRAGNKCETGSVFNPFFNMIRVDDQQTERTPAIQYHKYCHGHSPQMSSQGVERLTQAYAVMAVFIDLLQKIADELPAGADKSGLQLVIDAQRLGVNPNAGMCPLVNKMIGVNGGYQVFEGNGSDYRYFGKGAFDSWLVNNETDPTTRQRLVKGQNYVEIPQDVVEFFVRWNAWKSA